jgi:dTMP kinase
VSNARFIYLEGIEGAGKSTVGRLVCEWLAKRSIAARLTREPGGTPLAESVRNIALAHAQEPLSAVAETLLMFAARSIHVDNLIRPTLARGEWLVCDRFTDATRAYQGSGRGVDSALIERLAQAVHPDLQPDCTLLLDLPVSVGLARARARSGVASDRFEAEAEAFFERVRAGYLEIVRREPNRVRVIDASVPLDQVERQVGEVLASLVAAA